MKPINKTKFPFAMLVALALLVTAPAVSAEKPEHPNDTLSFVETLARDVRQDTATLKSYARFPMLYSRESHTRVLSRVRDNVNTIGDKVQKLHTNRSDLQTWQAELVTRLLPRLENLSNDTEKAIKFINDNPEEAFRPRYESYVDDMYDASNAIVRNVDNFLTWADEMAEEKTSSE